MVSKMGQRCRPSSKGKRVDVMTLWARPRPSELTRHSPWGLCVDRNGCIVIADFSNDLVRMMTPEGIVSTLAGSRYDAMSGLRLLDGPALEARFWCPWAVAEDAFGDVLVADESNNVIRKVERRGDAGDRVSTFAGTGRRENVDGPLLQVRNVLAHIQSFDSHFSGEFPCTDNVGCGWSGEGLCRAVRWTCAA